MKHVYMQEILRDRDGSHVRSRLERNKTTFDRARRKKNTNSNSHCFAEVLRVDVFIVPDEGGSVSLWLLVRFTLRLGEKEKKDEKGQIQSCPSAGRTLWRPLMFSCLL